MTDSLAAWDPVIEERLKFETMLADLSSRFVNLPPDELDRVIEDAERQVCECLGFDMAVLWTWSVEDAEDLRLTHLYRPLGGPPVPESMEARTYFPWCLQELKAGRIINLASIDDAPPAAVTDIEWWRHFDVKSVLGFPLAAGGGPVFGVLNFNSQREARAWPDDIVQRVGLVAQVFANALERKRSESLLRANEERLNLAAESGDVGMWMLDLGSRRFWATERAREIFGYGPDTDITLDRVLESVHPSYREPVAEAIRGAVEKEHEIDIEYRIVLSDGRERWVHSRGRVQSATASSPKSLLGATIDVTDRKLSESMQIEQLRFETLLADLSKMVLSAPADEIDTAVSQAQQRVCDFLDIELCALWQWSPANPGSQQLTHLYRPGGGPPIPDRLDAREHFPWSLEQVLAGRVIALTSIDDAPPEASVNKESWRRFGVKSTLILPLEAGGEPAIGSLSFSALREERSWPDDLVKRLRLVAEILANALKRKYAEEQLSQSYSEIERLKNQLEIENAYLRREHRLEHGHGRIVGESPAIVKVLELAEQVAPTRSTVLIEGETGTGKELIAQRIHELSTRGGRTMVKVNCAALPSTLVESELFGREKGAYTGAVSREPGRFEVADGSTLLLDEVAELPLELQSKLLRVLEEGRFERVGSSKTIATDVRVIAATNRDLQAEVEAGRFRRDLFFRLAVFPIRLPPLRERRDDIPLLVWAAVEEFGAAMHRSVENIRRQDLEKLQLYSWPGNVRELRNVVERAMILSNGSTLRVEPPTVVAVDGEGVVSLDDAQRRHITRALEAANGRIAGPGGAADLLGLKPTTLRSKMQRLEIDPDLFRHDRPSL